MGVAGIVAVMRELDMLRSKPRRVRPARPVVADSSHWVRAPEGGILRTAVRLGQRIRAGELLGQVSDPFGAHDVPVTAPHAGIVIGRNSLPLVNEGDALLHIARVERPGEAVAAVEAISDAFRDPPRTNGGGSVTSS